LEVIPYTPAAGFAGGRTDPDFRTKLVLAVELVKQAAAWHWPFKAVVADSFYGEDATVWESLQQLGVGYVLALKPSHSWWHPVSEPGSLDEVARDTPWQARAPGTWQAVERAFRDGHLERWWALEIKVGPHWPRGDRNGRWW
jgi:SRSO17 transposase